VGKRLIWIIPSMDTSETNSGLRYDENATCDRCGKFGAFDLGGRFLCAACYEEAGACCPEFGAATCGGIVTRIDPQGL
jgi:protein-arginine kinase activator protein McsA